MSRLLYAHAALLPDGWARNVAIDIDDAGDVQQRGHHASVPKNACPRSRYLTQRIARDASADSARFHYDQCLFVRSERSRLVIS